VCGRCTEKVGAWSGGDPLGAHPSIARERAMASKIETFQRTDGLWAWHLVAGNGEIVATDGGQGYENKRDAERTADAVARGRYAPAE